MDEIARLCDRMAVLDDGRIVAPGDARGVDRARRDVGGRLHSPDGPRPRRHHGTTHGAGRASPRRRGTHMISARREWQASYAFIELNFRAIKRYWGWEAVWLAFAIVNSLTVAYIAPGGREVTGEAFATDRLVLFLVIGTIVWAYLQQVFDSVGFMIAWQRWEGTIESTFMAPARRLTMVAGHQHVRDRLRLCPCAGCAWRGIAVLRPRSASGQLAHGVGRDLRRQHRVPWPRGHGGRPTAAVPGARRANGDDHARGAAARVGRVLSDRGAAGLAAGRGASFRRPRTCSRACERRCSMAHPWATWPDYSRRCWPSRPSCCRSASWCFARPSGMHFAADV